MSAAAERRYLKFASHEFGLAVQYKLNAEQAQRAAYLEEKSNEWRAVAMAALVDAGGFVGRSIRVEHEKRRPHYLRLLSAVTEAHAKWAHMPPNASASERAVRSIQYAKAVYAYANFLRGCWKFAPVDSAPNFIKTEVDLKRW